jgi:WhiB family transcriptional regulator, redox-sensing transcriptional regulator
MGSMRVVERTEQRSAEDGLAKDYSWQVDSSCRGVDPEIFFPTTDEEASAAIAICETCPVRLHCLAFALERNERYGVWGGLAEKERQKLSPAARENIRRQVAA